MDRLFSIFPALKIKKREECTFYQFDSINVTEAHIINSGNEPTDFFGSLYNSDGTRLGELNVKLSTETVPPKGRAILTAPLSRKYTTRYRGLGLLCLK